MAKLGGLAVKTEEDLSWWAGGEDRGGFEAVDTVQNLRLAGGGDRRLWATGGSWVSGLRFRETSRCERERDYTYRFF